MENLSKIYSEFATELQFGDLSSEVTYQAKKCIFDLLGVALAGSVTDLADITFGFYSEIGGKPESTVIAKKRKLPSIHTAFLNGIFAHALELDDGHRKSGIHPGSSIIPSALAAAEVSAVNGKELIVGIVAGYEVAIRIGKAIAPSHVLRGFHPTGTVGTFGAAIAASRILRIGYEKTIMAMGMAGLFSGGLLQVMDEGGMIKPINPGKAASGGLVSAYMASRGILSPEKILEGEKGFLKAASDHIDYNSLTKGLGTEYEICKVYFKIHSCCRHIHPSIDALLEIMIDNSVEAESIEHVLVETYPVAVRLCGHNLEKVAHSNADAKFSLPMTLALASYDRKCDSENFSKTNLSRPAICKLARKIEVVSSEKWGALYPEKRGATVILKAQGKTYRHEVGLAKGDPENPVSFKELHAKFVKNAAAIMTEKQAIELGKSIMNLDGLFVSELSSLLE